jgi:hypothetical protein
MRGAAEAGRENRRAGTGTAFAVAAGDAVVGVGVAVAVAGAAGATVASGGGLAAGVAGGGVAGAPKATTLAVLAATGAGARRASVRPSVTPPPTATARPSTTATAVAPRLLFFAGERTPETVLAMGGIDATAGGTVSFETLSGVEGVDGRCSVGRCAAAWGAVGAWAAPAFGIVAASRARSFNSRRNVSRVSMRFPSRARF